MGNQVQRRFGDVDGDASSSHIGDGVQKRNTTRDDHTAPPAAATRVCSEGSSRSGAAASRSSLKGGVGTSGDPPARSPGARPHVAAAFRLKGLAGRLATPSPASYPPSRTVADSLIRWWLVGRGRRDLRLG